MLWLLIAGIVTFALVGWDMQQLHRRIAELEQQVAQLRLAQVGR